MEKATENDKQVQQPAFNERTLLTEAFAQPVNFYTYAGRKTLKVRRVVKYAVLGWKGESLSKLDIVFAFPKAQLQTMKAGITIQKNVQAQELRTPTERKDRGEAPTDAELRQGDAKSVRLLMRSGHVLRGKQISVSQYNILMEISGETVLVYRHALMEHTIEGTAETPSMSE